MSSESRVGKKWTIDEEEELLESIKKGVTYEEIAQSLRRNIGGIKSKAIDVALNTFSNEMTPLEISEFIKIPYEDIIKRSNYNSIKSLTTKPVKIKSIDFEILWKFKIFLKSKIQFDEEMHDYFDEFVKTM